MAILDVLPREERIPLQLRTLYENLGYRKYRMGKFEPYDVYRDNRSFLNNARIITFTDTRGRLMALKPDVTISIVKNTAEDTACRKLYYLENVFRMEHGASEYNEIRQMGLEFIGGDTLFAEMEVVSLALSTLETIGGESLLVISHMGYLSALLDVLALCEADRAAVLREIRRKNPAEVLRIAETAGLSAEECRALETITSLSGTPEEVLPVLRSLSVCEEMCNAVEELEALIQAVSPCHTEVSVRLDLSMVNDVDYYNGLVFQGFLRGVPEAVLAGGRYDNLMRRFQKPQPAIGFALYLSELDRALRTVGEFDSDTLLIYGESEPALVMKAVNDLLQGGSVRAEKDFPEDLRVRRICRLLPDGTVEEVSRNA